MHSTHNVHYLIIVDLLLLQPPFHHFNLLPPMCFPTLVPQTHASTPIILYIVYNVIWAPMGLVMELTESFPMVNK
jgi:hypothetical protein